MKKSYLPHVSQQNSKWFEWKVQEMILAKLKIIWMSDDPTVVDLLHTYYLSAPSLSPSLKLYCIALQWQLFSLKMTIFSNLTKLIEKG